MELYFIKKYMVNNDIGYLTLVAVSESNRRMGVCTSMIQEGISWAKREHKIYRRLSGDLRVAVNDREVYTLNILVMSAYYEPERVGSIYLPVNLYEGFAGYGWNVLLYTPTPARGVNKEVRKSYKKQKKESKINDRLQIKRIALYGEGRNLVLRAVRYMLMNMIFIWKGIHTKADIIFVQSTPPTQGAMAAVIKKMKKIPFVYNVQDVFPDNMVSMKLTHKNSLIWKVGRKIEDFSYRNADKIIVISENMKRLLMEKGVEENKLEVVYNWTDTEKVVPIKRENNFLFEQLGIDRNKFNVVYAGNLGYAQNISVILQAAKLLEREEKIQFLIFGQKEQQKEYLEEAGRLKLNNTFFYELLEYDKVSYVYSLGDAGLVSCKTGFGRSSLPSKTWSIMATGTPVIASFDPDTDLQRIIDENHAGIFCTADDAQELSAGIRRLFQYPDMQKEYGENAVHFIQTNLNKEVCVKKYIDTIEEVHMNNIKRH